MQSFVSPFRNREPIIIGAGFGNCNLLLRILGGEADRASPDCLSRHCRHCPDMGTGGPRALPDAHRRESPDQFANTA